LHKRISTLILLLLLAGAFASACGQAPRAPDQLPVGSLWKPSGGQAAVNWPWDWVQADGFAQEGLDRAIRRMAEEQKVLALMGPAGNEETMRAASLVNFFKVPMVVASADGNNIIPANNQWAFRLSASAEDYSRFMFDDVLNRLKYEPEVTALLSDKEIRMAVLYEDNTFGESAAVEIVRAAKPKPKWLSIEVYEKFTVRPIGADASARPGDQEQMARLAKEVFTARTQLVMLVCSDPQAALMMVEAIKSAYGSLQYSPPIIIGQAGGFASAAFGQGGAAQGVYVLRQKIDPEDCPPEIQAADDAQNYAAAFLLARVVGSSPLPKPAAFSLPFFNKPDPNALVNQRLDVYNQLKSTKGTIPCVGQVEFDAAFKNKYAYGQIELTQVWNGVVEPLRHEDFWMSLGTRVMYEQ
jgi:hypothetical protein